MSEAQLPLGDPLSQDDTKFFLLDGRTTPMCKPAVVDGHESTNSVSADDGLFTSAAVANAREDSAERYGQHHCVLGTPFIIESTSSMTMSAAAATAAVHEGGVGAGVACKAEPVDHSNLDAWAAAAAAASNQHILFLQQQQQQQHHSLLHHQQPALSQSQGEPAKLLLLPSLSPGTLAAAAAAAAAASANYGHHNVGHVPDQTPKRCRTNLTEEQKMELEKTFAKSKYPDYPIVDELSRRICLPYKKVLVWFKNRRAKEKRTRKADFDHCGGGGGGSDLGTRRHADVGPCGIQCASTSAKAAAAAAAAAASFNYPYATQYSNIRQCLPPPPAPALYHGHLQNPGHLQHPAHQQHQLGAGATGTAYWMSERELPSSMATTTIVKCEPGVYHHQQCAFPIQQQHQQMQPITHQYVFVTGENIATQTSPLMLEFEDAVADVSGGPPLSANCSGSIGGIGADADADAVLVKMSSSQEQGLQLEVENQHHQQLVQPGYHLPPFSIVCRPSSVASASAVAAAVAFDAADVGGDFLDDAEVRIP